MSSLDPRRRIPRTDAVLGDPLLADAIAEWGIARVKDGVVASQQRVRNGELAPEELIADVLRHVPARSLSMSPVLNATGVVLHTNLGRAPLSPAARAALADAAGYVDVEFDLASGARAPRGEGALDALRSAVPEAEDVLIVNNGAAALLLAASTLSAGQELIVSRGEMVEIGDGFRLPDLIGSAGVRIREVGMTNRTSLADYTEAVGPSTGCILKVHPSNFQVTGYTSQVSISELATAGPPVVVDVGSGLLHPDTALPDEPDVTTALREGAAIVTCSGDKLLGGPQAGLAFGPAAPLRAMRRNPMARALRVDKLTLAALEATLHGPTPTWRYLHADPAALRTRSEGVAAAIGAPAHVVPCTGVVGGGGAPGVELPGWAIALPEDCAARLRSASPVVIGRLDRGRCLLDLRCVEPADDPALVAAARSALT
jgi:L-seryl-tRNA(Ser) seleniumtransferase